MYGNNANHAIQIFGLDKDVTEYDVSKVIERYAKTNIELENGVATLRDYSPELMKCLTEAFPRAQVKKVDRQGPKGRAFF